MRASLTTLLLLLACAPAAAPRTPAPVGAAPAARAPAIPAYLVGEWATANARFQGVALFEGAALYLDPDGSGALIGGPPPIGMRLTAQFDSASAMLATTLRDNENAPITTARFRYDRPTQTLRGKHDGSDSVTYSRRQPQVPAAIRRMLCDVAAPPPTCS